MRHSFYRDGNRSGPPLALTGDDLEKGAEAKPRRGISSKPYGDETENLLDKGEQPGGQGQ